MIPHQEFVDYDNTPNVKKLSQSEKSDKSLKISDFQSTSKMTPSCLQLNSKMSANANKK